MVNFNIGSISNSVHNRLDNIPSSYSGAEMAIDIGHRIQYMDNFLGVTINSDAITEDYQGPLTLFAMADTALVIESQGVDSTNVKIGEFSETKGSSSSASSASDKFTAKAMKEMAQIKSRYRTYKAWG